MIQRNSAPLSSRKKVALSATTVGTFAPAYLKSAVERKVDPAAEAAFGEKKWIWVKDEKAGFLKAWITQEDATKFHVRCSDDSDRIVLRDDTDRVNPPKFDGIQDMASLTYLNEPSVAHNLEQRYESGSIYTYSGLFLVAVNPYRALPIYDRNSIDYFKNRNRDEIARPHVFGTSDLAYRNMLEQRENQSILVTGESGAGKTENTKKVIQYLAAIASKSRSYNTSQDSRGDLEQQIIQANPILEAFGNAQTVRNDNSSRFGKFIRIQFDEQGQIRGAHINWFLLEKSRVVKQTAKERNYHVFYQLLAGASPELKTSLLLEGTYKDYEYLKHSQGTIAGVDDREMFAELVRSFHVMQFSEEEQHKFFRVIAAILLIGNIQVASDRADQARLSDITQVEKVCHILGIAVGDFSKALLTPKVKAGREWVTSSRTATQVKSSLAALARSLYERNFGALVDRINQSTERSGSERCAFIGVLDMAGFEIFQQNSFEQLCINYTNEKLQQFFNHHMFVLEQEEYAREQIEWKFIDFGLDLQPTIELIEKSNPIGILSCLDEESVMPKATDVTFTEKLHHLWKGRSSKYRTAKFPKDGFVLTHYAADVEYSTVGWLEKNQDPLNENITQLLVEANVAHITRLFADSDLADGLRTKKGLFRTVAQRHKEQLASLMSQLNSTQPHFIRCIIPNHEKNPRRFDFALVLDQLRCNGVLEGIRIARTGFPNRLPFTEFRQRYSVLAPSMPSGYIEGQKAAQLILDTIEMDTAYYRIGLSKVFFRAGVLAELEERRESMFRSLVIRLQAVSLGYLRRHLAHKRLHRKEATALLKTDLKAYIKLARSPWWQLFMKMKPVLSATKSDREMKMRSAEILKLEALAKSREEASQKAVDSMQKAEAARQQLEDLLNVERTTAADKEELFLRSRERESLLREDLDLALADVDTLENRCDELLLMKRDLEHQIDELRADIDQGSLIAEKLQSERSELANRLNEVTATLDDRTAREEELKTTKDTTERLLAQLRNDLHISQQELDEVRSKYAEAQAELKKTSKLEDSQVKKLQKKLDEALLEKKAARVQLDEMVASISVNDLLIRKKDGELSELKNKLSQHTLQATVLQHEKSDHAIRLESLESQISNLNLELSSAQDSKSSLENELKILKAGTPEKSASLETEITDLRKRLSEAQADRLKDSSTARVAMEARTREAETHRISVQRLEVINGDLVKQIAKSMQEILELKRELKCIADAKQHLDIEKSELKSRLLKADTASDSVDLVRSQLHRQLADAQERARAAMARASQVDVEKERFRREALDMKARYDELLLQRNSGDSVSKKHDLDLAAAHTQLKVLTADHEAIKNELRKSRAKLDHVNRLDEDLVAVQVRDVTKQKDAIEVQLSSVQEERLKLQQELQISRSTRSRSVKELEDLKHELDQEHQIAITAEKTTSRLKETLADSRAKLELEKQQAATAQSMARQLQLSLEKATASLTERTAQVQSLYRAVHGDQDDQMDTDWDKKTIQVKDTVNLADQLAKARQALKQAETNRSVLETQLAEMTRRHREMTDFDSKHTMYKARSGSISTLDISNSPHSPTRPVTAPWTPPQTLRAFGEPGRSRTNTLAQNFENKLMQSTDLGKQDTAFKKVLSLQSEIEALQKQLDKALKSRSDVNASDLLEDKENHQAVVNRLTRENKRLHELLDDNAVQVDAMESAQRRDRESLREMQSKSMDEIESTFQALAQEKIELTRAQRQSLSELEKAKVELEKLRKANASLQNNLQHSRKQFEAQAKVKSQESTIVVQLEDDLADAQLRAETEAVRVNELAETVKMYRQRAEEYFDRLELAEATVTKAAQSEHWAKQRLRDSENALEAAVKDRQAQDVFISKIQTQIRDMEMKLEDGQLEVESVVTQKTRLQQELEQYRSIKNQELEERDQTAEQTRKSYQRELVSLSGELENERGNAIKLREDNRAIRAEIEDLRTKRTEDHLNAATWEKEAQRKENKLQDLIKDLQHSEVAQRESQNRVISMLSEIRELRMAKEELEVEKEELKKQKASVEAKYKSISSSTARVKEDLDARSSSPSQRDLQAVIAEKEDLLQAMLEKINMADDTALTAQRDVLQEREANVLLHKQKVALENEKKELQLRMVDLETKSSNTSAKDAQFFQARILELEKELNNQDRAKREESRSIRITDRAIKDLEATVAQREATQKRLVEKASKAEARAQSLQADLEALRDEDAANKLRARRAERDVSDQRERALRAEKELERYKSRDELNKMTRSNTMLRLNGNLSSLRSEPSMRVSSNYTPNR
ncbi:putative Myosin type II heavy chain [Taphrina deformans PYCC 5710]|uniref:Myosin type II heavy chain n=1 Tax=Taphrina deformans (strain PYCC 5710 / ATCC 11124 / CBS 356.35 / IMI 108563 / JCM 9778 / NBRC 8474) TaxID=1097556 RepID=R4XBP3_TAPDE|nr:putative Myosin type II heavy chain [Taphrina deformans PYCC 5710]|eukprot:CCG81796.1 putative Myosin type II heavy chain [Taphrina deformans PYCC 5710]